MILVFIVSETVVSYPKLWFRKSTKKGFIEPSTISTL